MRPLHLTLRAVRFTASNVHFLQVALLSICSNSKVCTGDPPAHFQ